MIHDQPGDQAARRRADALHGGDRARAQVVPPGAPHEIRHHQRRQRTEDACADAVEQLDSDQPRAVVGQRVEHSPDRQDAKPTRRRGLRPQVSAVRPTRRAIGSITSCAAMMQDDIHGRRPFPVREGELLTDQRKQRRVGKVEEQARNSRR